MLRHRNISWKVFINVLSVAKVKLVNSQQSAKTVLVMMVKLKPTPV